MMVSLLLLIGTLSGQEITVRNNMEDPLPAGHPLSLKIDRGRAPVFVKYQERTIASHFFDRGRLWFKTQKAIAGGESDSGYTLHSGTAKAPPGETVFDLFEDFSGKAHPFQDDPSITLVHEKGRLLIPDFPEGHSTLSPARLSLNLKVIPQNFALSLDLECVKNKPGYAKYGIEILFRRKEALPEKQRKKIDILITQLASESWDIREGATHELIRIGAPALKQVTTALKSTDAEVRLRAGHILREIHSGGSWPGIMAGFEVDHGEIRPVAFTWRIGRTTNRMRHVPQGPIRVHLEIRRDQDGYVTISWNGRKPTLPVEMKGEVEGIHLYGFQSVPGSSTLAVDNLFLRRFLDEEERPVVILKK